MHIPSILSIGQHRVTDTQWNAGRRRGDEYRAAMAFHKKRLAKIRRKKLPSSVRELILRVRRSHVLKPIRRSPLTRVEIDPRVAAFLKEVDRVDYGLMGAAW